MKSLFALFTAGTILLTGCSGGAKTVAVQGTGGGNFQKPSVEPPPLVETESGFVALDKLELDANSFAEKLTSDAKRRNLRFLVACDQTNQGNSLESFVQGVNKGLNMMSQDTRLHKVTPVGDNKCLYAIDIGDYGISTAEWQKVVDNSQLKFVTQTIRGQNLQALTQTQTPYMFAVDFFLTAYEGDAVADKNCNVWCDLSEDPGDLNGYFAGQGVNLQQSVNDQDTIIAAFGQSQIALGKNRVVELVPNDQSWCMSTYDTGLAAQENAFLNPFTVEMANAGGIVRSNKIFQHDAQEHMCQLKNGMWGAFRLNGANGASASFAPNDVVVNTQFAGVDPTIRNVDCAACHHTEIAIGFRDGVGAAIKQNNAFNDQEKKLGQIFYDSKKMADALAEINQGHQDALRALDITDGTDPFNNAVIRPFRQEMNASQVAAFTFMETADFLEALKGTSRSSQTLGNLVNGGTVSIGTLKAAYPDLVRELNLFQDIEL